MADPVFIEGKATTAYMEEFLSTDDARAVLLGPCGASREAGAGTASHHSPRTRESASQPGVDRGEARP